MPLIELKDTKMDSWDWMGNVLDKGKAGNKAYLWVFFNVSKTFNP